MPIHIIRLVFWNLENSKGNALFDFSQSSTIIVPRLRTIFHCYHNLPIRIMIAQSAGTCWAPTNCWYPQKIPNHSNLSKNSCLMNVSDLLRSTKLPYWLPYTELLRIYNISFYSVWIEIRIAFSSNSNKLKIFNPKKAFRKGRPNEQILS